MSLTESSLAGYLLNVLTGVLEDSGISDPGQLDPEVRFADVFDSMAMVEFLGIVAEDCGCAMGALEEAVGQRYSTVQDLAKAMYAAGIAPQEAVELPATSRTVGTLGSAGARAGSSAARQLAQIARTEVDESQLVYLAGSSVRLPRTIQRGEEMDAAVGRPVGWLERRAGILQRRIWGNEDPIEAAAGCATDALRSARVPREQLNGLIVVSEAPPMAIGLGAAIHDHIGLRSNIPCYEMGGACTGFLSAISLAKSILARGGSSLIVSVEAHSRLLPLEPGPYGESAALFGDGCAAVVLDGKATGERGVKLIDMATFVDGAAADLIRVQSRGVGTFGLEMEGVPLTEFALHALSAATRDIAAKHALPVAKLAAIVAHGGNGRMPAMLARLLHVPPAKVWSEVTMTGNLGSASVPVAWASNNLPGPGYVVWTSVGAGLVWGSALWEIRTEST
jgi:3-oxoacyl-[acyl-carrier-protein] synthase-3